MRKQSLINIFNYKKAKISRREEELEKEINSLQCLIKTSNMKEKDKKDTLSSRHQKKIELEKIIEYRTKGPILKARCRCRHNEGEKKFKRFSQPRETTISQLKLENENFVATARQRNFK